MRIKVFDSCEELAWTFLYKFVNSTMLIEYNLDPPQYWLLGFHFTSFVKLYSLHPSGS